MALSHCVSCVGRQRASRCREGQVGAVHCGVRCVSVWMGLSAVFLVGVVAGPLPCAEGAKPPDRHARARTGACTGTAHGCAHVHAHAHAHARMPARTGTHAHTHARTHARARTHTPILVSSEMSPFNHIFQKKICCASVCNADWVGEAVGRSDNVRRPDGFRSRGAHAMGTPGNCIF